MKVLQGEVDHSVKVTRIKPGLWGIRVFVDGVKNQESVVDSRIKIGPEIRSMLRMEDKVGNLSDLAHNSRHRPGRKKLQ